MNEYDDIKYMKENNLNYESDEIAKMNKDKRIRDWLNDEKLVEFHPSKIQME